MNLTTLQTRLRERIGNPTTTDVPDATLTVRLNEAYQDILDRFRFRKNRKTDTSITTVASTGAYNLPNDVSIVLSVKDETNDVKLVKRDRDWVDAWDDDTATGKPLSYFIDASQINLFPVPDDAYSIKVRYIYDVTDLSAGGDTPVLPTSWHHGIVLLARYKYWEVVDDAARMQTALAAWQSWISTKTVEFDEEKLQDYDQAIVVPTLQQPTSRLDFDHSE